MVLDKIPNTKLFVQRDVRETPAGTATASAVGLTDGKYIVIDYHADMTDERKITAGEGIDFVDGGANSTFTIDCEIATSANKGVAKFDSTDFSVTAGDVTINAERIADLVGAMITGNTETGIAVTYQDADNTIDFVVDHDAANNFVADEHLDWKTDRGANNIHVNNITAVPEGAVTTHVGAIDHDSTLNFAANEHIDWTADQGATNIHAGNYTDTGDTTYTANETNITLVGTEFRLKNKTSYWSCSGFNFHGTNPDADNIDYHYDEGWLRPMADGINVVADVQLPHGAVVTGAIVYGDATASAETWTLLREEITTGGAGEVMATANVDTEDTSISDATIDNSTYMYFLKVPSIDTGDTIFGARITYTTDYI